MIVKSMSRRTPSFSQVLSYIADQEVAAGPALLHNLTARAGELSALKRAFLGNAKHCQSRKNGVFLYHEILSLSKADAARATPEILLDLAERYLALRAPDAMAYGVVHLAENPHIHLVISGNQVGRSRKTRISRAEFQRVKQELEAYQIERYPQLSRSIAQKRRSGASQKLCEVHMKRKGSPTTKDRVRETVDRALSEALSLADYRQRLASAAMTPYARCGRHGVIFEGRKYRLTTLGLETAFLDALETWQRIPRRLADLDRQRLENARRAFSDRLLHISEGRRRKRSLLHELRLEPEA